MKLIVIPEGPNVETLTERTIALMSAFARAAVRDPLIVQAAACAWRRFGRGFPDLGSRAVGVWHWLRHAMEFQSDSDTMLILGVPGHHDLVIDPRILVRMKRPKEDCDGFSTFGAALLSVLGVPWRFAVAATEPDDRRRWSHVWLQVNTGGGWQDFDCSHGLWPGWGVPAARRFRFQTFNSNGVATNV